MNEARRSGATAGTGDGARGRRGRPGARLRGRVRAALLAALSAALSAVTVAPGLAGGVAPASRPARTARAAAAASMPVPEPPALDPADAPSAADRARTRDEPPPESAAGRAWAAMADMVFEHLGRGDGLPNEIATAVEEDDQGFLWVGTEEGLARWDGYRFRVYGADAGDPRRLAAGFVRALRRDAQGRLWIGTDSGGLARLDPADGGFTRVGGNLSVVGLAADRDGGMWVATTTGLLHVLSGDVVEQPWRHDAGTPEALPDPSVTAVLQRRSGDVWIGMAASLVVRHPDGRPGRTVELPGIEAGTPAGVNALYEDIDGRVWIGTALHGAYVWDPADAQVHRLRAMPGARAGEPPLDSDAVTAFAESAPGEVWVGTATRGLLVVEARTHVARRVMQDRAVPTGLQSNWVWALHRDRSGQMWIGSTSGLSRTRPREDAVLAIVPSEARGWSDPSVLAVEAAPDGVLTLGQHGGLVTVDPFARRITPLRARSQGEDDSPVFGYISAIARTADGRLFLGAKEGLFVRLPGAPRLQEWTLPQRQRVKGVNALLCDGQTLWIGGKFDGVWTMDLASAAHVVARPDVRGQLTDPQVNTLARAPDGAIWVGTKNGLNRLVPGQAIEQILSTPGDPATLPDGVVSALLFDREGRLWVATNAGLAVMERRDGAGRPVFRRLGLAQGLTSLNVDKLLLDAQGRVWASTDDGLLVVDPATLAVRALHAAEGVAISTYWANSGAASADGSLLFFGGLGGLTIVRPERLRAGTTPAPLVFTDLQVGSARAAAGPQARALAIPPEAEGSFAAEFSLLDFTAPERARYAYWLEGHDHGWREVDTAHRLASYTNLAPGRYRLHVKAADRDGNWTGQPVSLRIDVLPAWYQSWWFLGVKLLAAGLAVTAIVAVRLRLVRRRNAQLERLVGERTQELQRLQAQLEELAYSDALTGLPNRRMFGDWCRNFIAAAQRRRGGFALLLIDLDHFKQVNDTRGHDAGDALLVETARRLRGVARRSDVVARLGGDEFAILLADAADRALAEATCRRILEAFAEPAELPGGAAIRVTPSIGVALFPVDGTTQDALYKSADLALYEAKAGGRNTWRFARP